ncbi:MAG TPA: AAA family ATPase, partial [Aggregatilineales bacterium]|nr:AAA family ATPase [Aggregatilineales bacterium]
RDLKQVGFGLRIGLAVGAITLMTIGEANRWRQWCVGGQGLQRAIGALEWATRNGVVAHISLGQILGPKLPIAEVREDRSFYAVNTDDLNYPNRSSYVPLETYVSPESERILKQSLPDLLAQQPPQLMTERRLLDRTDAISLFMAFKSPDYDQPEAADLLQGLVADVAPVIHRFGGAIYQVEIDNRESRLFTVFGAYSHSNDDRVNALNCALALQQSEFASVREQRIAIAQGRLSIGAAGPAHWRAMVAFGSSADVARRLCQRTQPGQIIVDAEIEHLTDTDFQFAALLDLPRDDHVALLPAWLLEGQHTIDGYLAARYMRDSRAMIGRQIEVAILEQKVQEAWEGHGSALAISGPPGIGKSRLIAEVVKLWSNRGGAGYLGSSSPFADHVPYLSWMAIWTAIFGLRSIGSPDSRREQVIAGVQRLEPTLAVSPAAALLCRALNIPPGVGAPELSRDPRALQTQLADISLALIRGLAKNKPILLVFDGFQTADSGSRALVDYISTRIGDLPVLMIVESQTAERDPFTLSRLELAPLTEVEGWELINGIVGQVDWPFELREKLTARLRLNEGACNPLHVEQTLALMVQLGILGGAGSGFHATPSASFEPINELADVLLARIEANDAITRTVLQSAVVIGHEFPFPLLKAINASLSDEQLEALLNRLHHIGLIDTIFHTTPSGRRDRFAHELMGEIVFQNLPTSRRRAFHLAIAEELVRDHPADSDSDVSDALIAFHFDQAEQFVEAARYSIRAATAARMLHATSEALHHFAIAERSLNRFRGDEAVALRYELALNRGIFWTDSERYDEALTDFHEALNAAHTRGDVVQQARVYNAMARTCVTRKDAAGVAANAEKSISLTKNVPENAVHVEALFLQGEGFRLKREFSAALAVLTRASKIIPDQFALELSADIANSISQVQFDQFDFGAAHAASRNAVHALRTVGNRRGLAWVLGNLAQVEGYLGNSPEAQSAIAEAVVGARDTRDTQRLGYLLLRAGAIACYEGRYRESYPAFEEARSVFERTQDSYGLRLYHLTFAREYTRDHNEPQAVITVLEPLLPLLREGWPRYVVIEGLLTLADSYIRREDLHRASNQLQLVDTLIAEGKYYWYRPETLVLKTQIAIGERNYPLAYQLACAGLGAVGDLGDVRMLTPIYRLLALVLERDRSRIDDARDALERAIVSGRSRARKVDLAMALRHAGLHLRRFSNRPTVRARGSGYLFESDRLFEEMNVPIPRHTLPGMATSELSPAAVRPEMPS